MRPMLATSGAKRAWEVVPDGEGWRHEIKWDGVRLLVDVRESGVTAHSRNERDVSVGFPELAGLGSVAADLLVDGEAVAFSDGVPHFANVVDRIHHSCAAAGAQAAAARPVTYLIFDLLRLDGMDLTGIPWRDRRRLLEDLIPANPFWQVPPTYADGAQLLAATQGQGLEGIVSKRVDSRYHPGARSEDWLKFSHRPTRSFVVGGWRPEVGRARVGSLLVGTPSRTEPGRLAFMGRVGSGLSGSAGLILQRHLITLARDSQPFDEPLPALDAATAQWIQPTLVIDVASLGRTAGGRLRQPSFQRLRSDLTPSDLEQ